jgi:hypothetical protein
MRVKGGDPCRAPEFDALLSYTFLRKGRFAYKRLLSHPSAPVQLHLVCSSKLTSHVDSSELLVPNRQKMAGLQKQWFQKLK